MTREATGAPTRCSSTPSRARPCCTSRRSCSSRRGRAARSPAPHGRADPATRDIQPPWNLKLRHPRAVKHSPQSWVGDRRRRHRLPRAPRQRCPARATSASWCWFAPAQPPARFPPAALELHIIEGLEALRALREGAPRAGRRLHLDAPARARCPSADPGDRDTPLFLSRGSARDRPGSSDEEPGAAFGALLHGVREQLGSTRQIGARSSTSRSARRHGDDELIALCRRRAAS